MFTPQSVAVAFIALVLSLVLDNLPKQKKKPKPKKPAAASAQYRPVDSVPAPKPVNVNEEVLLPFVREP